MSKPGGLPSMGSHRVRHDRRDLAAAAAAADESWASQVTKNPPASAGDIRKAQSKGSITGSGRSPGGGHSNPL